MGRAGRVSVGMQHLAALLSLPAAEVRGLVAGLRPLRGREPRYRWSDISRRLTREQLAAAQIRARERRLANVSKRWVGGYPHLVAEWHPTKNGTLFPDEVSYGSPRQIWWRCDKGPDHEWRAPAKMRTRGSGCPFCTGRKVSVTNCLRTRVPAVAAQWHPTKNGRLTPRDVVWSSARVVWWKCNAGPDHEWQVRVNARTSGHAGCPFCRGFRLSITNSLATVAPALAAQWHSKKNGRLRPDDIVAHSNRKVWWRCEVGPDHIWQQSPAIRLSMDVGCPCCASKKPSRTNSIAGVAPQLAREWHPTRNGPLTPDRVFAGSNQVYWWRCSVNPRHQWRARPINRTRRHSGCPVCYRERRRGGRRP